MTQASVENIKTLFNMLRECKDPIDINTNISFNQGKWATIYLYAIKTNVTEEMMAMREQMMLIHQGRSTVRNEYTPVDDEDEEEYLS